MDTGTRKQLFVGTILVIGVAVLCWGLASVLGWLADTYGIWFGTRNT